MKSNSHCFKVGDVVEGTQSHRWVLGVVKAIINNANIAVEVINTREIVKTTNLHCCNYDGINHTPSGKGWFLETRNAKLNKNYIVASILRDL